MIDQKGIRAKVVANAMANGSLVLLLPITVVLCIVDSCTTSSPSRAFILVPDGGDAQGVDGPSEAAPLDGTPGFGDSSSSCVGLQCRGAVDDCAGRGLAPTTITGKVYDPAGKMPLSNIYAYIPNSTPDPITPGHPTCTRCQAPASGNPVIGALTDATGTFTLVQGTNRWAVPSGTNIPLVLQTGKWRRQIVIPSVAACATTALPDPPAPSEKLRLPAKTAEGDMPLIAFTSGCDPAECFLRDIGIDDSEFVPPGSATGHVQFYTGHDYFTASGGPASSVTGGNTPAQTESWWASAPNLLDYDIVFNACQCQGQVDYGAAANAAVDAT